MGFVSTPELGHDAVELGARALARLAHRGGLDADGKSGDGAGLLIQVPHRLLGGDHAVVCVFEWDERALPLIAQAMAAAGMEVLEWRRVPVDASSLGERARETMPGIWHGLIARSDADADIWESRLYRARRAAEREAAASAVRMYIPSCSSRTLVYKGLMAGTRLADFYLDLQDPDCESRLAVFHQRYSTNTMPDWRLAQPFRLLAHNGEINTVGANRAWMRAREAELEPELREVVWPEGSDSASLDNALELLVRRGWEASEALMSLVPDAWEGRGDLAPAVRDFYRYQSTKFEPWDGPAALAFSDGFVVGAALDRNGLRPLRWARTRQGMVAAASEAGVVAMEPSDVVERGRLGPGQMLLVDTRDNSVLRDSDAKERAASRHDYGLLADRVLVPVPRRHIELEPPSDLGRLSRRHHPAVPEHSRLLELESPVLGAGELVRILEEATLLDATCAPDRPLGAELKRLQQEAEQAGGVIAISDRRADLDAARVPIPMALAVGAVHEHLLTTGRRMAIDIIAIAGDVVDVHDVACLVTIGASAVHPYLAMATAGPEREAAYRKALEAGLLKVMAKMGISCAASYRGGLVLEALGLGAEVMRMCFPSMPSGIGVADLAVLDALARSRMAEATALPDHRRVRFRKTGEHHAYNPLGVRTAQKAAAGADRDQFHEWLRMSHMDRPQSLRELLVLRESASPARLDEVEPASEIVKRFVSTAMSLGALSPEAHEALALAMNQIGARSNSGEGGEDPDTYDSAAIRRDNRVKQVASARFGVTPAYLKRADELEIKIAQGSKPGEGGQLPGLKVTSLIARLRHAQPGMQLISPPPHHDIYSIEDLAQLIHDLKTVNPGARLGVKLVSEAGVGTIAAGVAKAKADYILLSGHDGGTGASPLSSIKNAGAPWELGLAEAQQVLVSNRLRERVSLRSAGGLRSGRDIVIAALLGAEEFGFGTGVLVALGCDMARQCHLNTCPTGIATQREDLRAKFEGRPEHVINYIFLIAEEVRDHLARLGARSVEEVVGRVELLEQDAGTALGPSDVLAGTDATLPRRRAWKRNGDAPDTAPPSGDIDNSRRTVGAHLARGERRSYRGSAGQSFGAFLDDDVELTLEGQAQDYVGKGMGGGVIAIRPFSNEIGRASCRESVDVGGRGRIRQ